MVEVEVERASGRFASRDELRGLLADALEDADPIELYCEAEGEYVTVLWHVDCRV